MPDRVFQDGLTQKAPLDSRYILNLGVLSNFTIFFSMIAPSKEWTYKERPTTNELLVFVSIILPIMYELQII